MGDIFEPDHDRYLRQIIDLLAEIRDRLPVQTVESRRADSVTIFGWPLDSEDPPNIIQVAAARDWLQGRAYSTQPYLTPEFEAVVELLRHASEPTCARGHAIVPSESNTCMTCGSPKIEQAS